LKVLSADRKADRLVVTEMVGGVRKEAALDEKTFAQRATSLAADIGKGGEACGKAFWGNEAIKAATTALAQ
jgi:hypothetical protein